MENAVNCTGRAYVIYLATLTGVDVAFAVLLAGSSVFVGVLFSVFALMFGVELSRTCHRVDLRSENELVLHYLFRQRVVRPASITSIELDTDPDGESPAKFVAAFDGGRFEVSANRSARRLVDALVRLEPTIAVSGYKPVVTTS